MRTLFPSFLLLGLLAGPVLANAGETAAKHNTQARYTRGSKLTLPVWNILGQRRSVTIRLPKWTPYPMGSKEELSYLRAYGEGFADVYRVRYT